MAPRSRSPTRIFPYVRETRHYFIRHVTERIFDSRIKCIYLSIYTLTYTMYLCLFYISMKSTPEISATLFKLNIKNVMLAGNGSILSERNGSVLIENRLIRSDFSRPQINWTIASINIVCFFGRISTRSVFVSQILSTRNAKIKRKKSRYL